MFFRGFKTSLYNMNGEMEVCDIFARLAIFGLKLVSFSLKQP